MFVLRLFFSSYALLGSGVVLPLHMILRTDEYYHQFFNRIYPASSSIVRLLFLLPVPSSDCTYNSLQNYRILQELTTTWCPAREEHGYFLTPVFKCSTNPRVTTAHRWMKVDVLGRMVGGRGSGKF